MARRIGAGLAPALALVIMAAGAASAQTPPQGPPPVTVAEPARREIVEWNEYTGQFAAIDTVEVRSRVSGYLESVHFDDGRIVRKGDLLFVIDPRPFQAAADSARAAVTQAQARLDLAERQLQRASELRRSDAVSISVFDERQQEVRVAAAGLEVARADLRRAELDLEFTRIASPLDGRIGRREVSVGNLVSSGSTGQATLLTTIVSLDPIHFVFDMSESDYLSYTRAIAEGSLPPQRDGGVEVLGRLFDEKGWPRAGRLDFVDNRIDPTSGTIRVRAVFPNPDLFLTPGQFGRLRLPASAAYVATLVPDRAIVSDQAAKIVLTVAPDGTVVPKPVSLGPLDGGLRVVRSGLDPGDKVIVSGVMRARPGAKVTPVPGAVE